MGIFTNEPRPRPRARRTNTTRLGPFSVTSPASTARIQSPRSARQKHASSSGSAPVSASAPAPSGNTPAPLPYGTVRTLTAAARTIDLSSQEELARLAKRRGSDAWQAEAWEYFDTIGEIGFAFGMVANVLSRIRLYAAELGDASQAPAPADADSPGGGAAIAALRRLDSAFGGQPGLLRDAALNLCVTGECYLVQVPGTNFPHYSPETWDIRSTDELQVTSSGEAQLVTRRDSDAASRKKLPRNAFTARIWRPHPRYSDEAQSSMLALLDACAELQLINKTFRATARSRLNAGMLYLPDGLGVADAPDPDVLPEDDPDGEVEAFIAPSPVEDDSDDFEEALMDAMVTPISDEESASAVVPLLVRGPADFADKIKVIKFERSFDPALVARADKVLDRILAGIDVPKDVVAGMANVKYANAAVIDEGLYKAHIEPLAVLLCDALTVVYLHPALRAAGVDESEIKNYVVWYDPSNVTTKPNKSEDADTGFDKYLLGGSAWRTAHGFNDEDAPSPEEIALRLLIENPSLTPELSEALLSVFAPDVMERVREASQANNPAPLPDAVADALNNGSPPSPSPSPSSEQPAAPTPPADEATQPQQLNPEDLV